jgi:hypothetical protein
LDQRLHLRNRRPRGIVTIIAIIGTAITTPETMTVVMITIATVIAEIGAGRSGTVLATATATCDTVITIASVSGAGINRRVSPSETHYDYA